jgi:alginate O-acetyltransferase complex protein AlgI
LAYFKYTNFAIEILNLILPNDLAALSIKMPIGISFYTFQTMSYVIDVYQDASKIQHNYIKVLFYIVFFPQLVAGPILNYHDVADMINDREITQDKTTYGIKRFIYGLSKIVLLSVPMKSIADAVFFADSASLNIISAWIGAFCYSFQIFFDFSGYSDCAIGLGSIFGFKFNENFNYPYISGSIQEFWRRWHISLSTWFRLYVYIPLGGNRKGQVRTLINLSIVFLLTGLWHGASFNFIIWGVLHGIFRILEQTGILNVKSWNKVLAHGYVIFVVTFTFVIFNCVRMDTFFTMTSALFTGFSFTQRNISFLYELLKPSNIFLFMVCIVMSMPVGEFLKSKFKKLPIHRFAYVGSYVLLILCMLSLSTEAFVPNIYFVF